MAAAAEGVSHVGGERSGRPAVFDVAAGGDPSSWTWTFSASRAAAGGIVGYSGVDTANPIDVKVTGPASLVGALDRGNLLVEVKLGGLPPRDREYRLPPLVSLVGIPRERELEVSPTARTVSVYIEAGVQEKP